MGLVSPPCCALFSVAGGLFLFLMGLILSSSSHIYIKGIEDNMEASASCYKGASMYGGTLLLSLYFLARGRANGGSDDYGEGEGNIEARRGLLRVGPPTNYGT
jgi:hypothetical protein